MTKEIQVFDSQMEYAETVYQRALKWIETHSEKANTLEFELITAAAAFALSKIETLKKEKKRRWK